MALRDNRRRRGAIAEMNVVPYIDVMLVLVVILMVAAPFVNPSLINLPSVNKASKAPEALVEVIVFPDERLSVRMGKDLKSVDKASLVETVQALRANRPDVPVVIAADKSVRYEQVIDIMKLLQGADIPRVGLSLRIERAASAR